MIEKALTLKNVSEKNKITYKTIISIGIIILSVVLPQIFHIFVGAGGGMKWLPMYLPVLIGGCLLGVKWGLLVGVLSPLTSFIITSIAGNPMPQFTMLPFMMIELAIYGAISGLFSKKIGENGLWVFASVFASIIVGRSVYFGLELLFHNVVNFSTEMIFNQMKNCVYGLTLQIVIVPIIVIILKKLIIKEK